MKKRIRLATLILSLLLSVIAVMSIGTVAYAGEEEEEEEKHIWKVTYLGGVEDYYDDFAAPFADTLSRDGAVYTFLPDSFDLYMDKYVTVRAQADVTLDFRGKKIVCPETKEQQNDINKHMFSCTSSNGSTITFLMEGAEMYAAHQGRTAIQMTGKGRLVVDGGALGGKLFAPGAIHVYTDNTGDAEPSLIKNMYIYKPSGNMTGLISARQNGVIKIVDSVIVSPNASWDTVFLHNKGKVIVENSFVANLANGRVIGVNKDATTPSFQLHDGSFLYGSVSSEVAGFGMSFYPTSHYSENLSRFATDETDMSVKAVNNSVKIYSSTQVGSYTTATQKIKFNYVVAEDMRPSSSQNAASVWRMELPDGSFEYTDKFYSAFKYASDYKSFTLLKTVKIERSASAMIDGDFVIDLDGRNLIISDEYEADYPSFLSVTGTGNLTIRMKNSIVSVPKMTFISATGISNVTVECDGGFIGAKTVIDALDANVEIVNAILETTSGNAVSTDKNIILDGVTVVGGGVGQLVHASANVALLNKCKLFTTTGSCAVATNGQLSVSDSTYISGTVSATDIVLEDYAAFSHKPKASKIDKIILKENVKVAFTLTTYDGEKLTTVKKTYTFGYISSDLNENILANFTMDESVAFNLYIPTSVVEYADFAIRLSIDGLLMEFDEKDASKTVVSNREYSKFVYPYVYPTEYSSVINIKLISGDVSVDVTPSVSELFESSFAACEDEAGKSIMATYAAYACALSDAPLTNEDMISRVKTYVPFGNSFNVPVGNPYLDAEEQKLVIAFARGFTGEANATVRFGAEDITVYAEVGSKDISIPVYRLDPNQKIILTLIENGQEEEYSFYVFDLIDRVYDTGLGEYLKLYGAYLLSFKK